MWKSSSKGFRERAALSGFKNDAALWKESMSQAQSGWMSGQIPIDNSGFVACFPLEVTSFAFRFGVEQNEKLRACDDLKQDMVNLRTSVFAAITIPTWDRNSQMSKQIYNSKVAWRFSKEENKDARRQLLLDREYVNLTSSALSPRSQGFGAHSLPDYFCSGTLHQRPTTTDSREFSQFWLIRAARYRF